MLKYTIPSFKNKLNQLIGLETLIFILICNAFFFFSFFKSGRWQWPFNRWRTLSTGPLLANCMGEQQQRSDCQKQKPSSFNFLCFSTIASTSPYPISTFLILTCSLYPPQGSLSNFCSWQKIKKETHDGREETEGYTSVRAHIIFQLSETKLTKLNIKCQMPWLLPQRWKSACQLI